MSIYTCANVQACSRKRSSNTDPETFSQCVPIDSDILSTQYLCKYPLLNLNQSKCALVLETRCLIFRVISDYVSSAVSLSAYMLSETFRAGCYSGMHSDRVLFIALLKRSFLRIFIIPKSTEYLRCEVQRNPLTAKECHSSRAKAQTFGAGSKSQ